MVFLEMFLLEKWEIMCCRWFFWKDSVNLLYVLQTFQNISRQNRVKSAEACA